MPSSTWAGRVPSTQWPLAPSAPCPPGEERRYSGRRVCREHSSLPLKQSPTQPRSWDLSPWAALNQSLGLSLRYRHFISIAQGPRFSIVCSARAASLVPDCGHWLNQATSVSTVSGPYFGHKAEAIIKKEQGLQIPFNENHFALMFPASL